MRFFEEFPRTSAATARKPRRTPQRAFLLGSLALDLGQLRNRCRVGMTDVAVRSYQ